MPEFSRWILGLNLHPLPGWRCCGPCRRWKTRAITDERGVTVQVPVHPERIACISFFATDVALALGIKPVATTYMVANRYPDYLHGLTKDIKHIGQRAKPNLELPSEARPDLIVAMKRYRRSRPKPSASLRA